jgi:hypothetical protein
MKRTLPDWLLSMIEVGMYSLATTSLTKFCVKASSPQNSIAPMTGPPTRAMPPRISAA